MPNPSEYYRIYINGQRTPTHILAQSEKEAVEDTALSLTEITMKV
jgi:hypothetical protein